MNEMILFIIIIFVFLTVASVSGSERMMGGFFVHSKLIQTN